ncbi:TIGR01906 family membrane protein [Acetilactobacillus jinshanensis]|uniref:TIGR01906 family membrane protein n=1 Tax=Acetilactobacillus jinshanensis TaxID=1720083 RepID=A0A4P6ZLR9_9LACO|nr:TIGR01906 family membrane protein [Acetilactobacillus jinshanensis]QBP18714.1 TIGR01906 family membrane protein [Acetilactobacillus jinshanensis]URL61587.1 TIGR01906 family membrane protein [uncultured bacterium]
MIYRLKDNVKILTIIIFVILLSVFLTINVSGLFYWIAIQHFHLRQISGLSSASLMKCYFFMLRYLQVPWDSHLNLEFFRSSQKGLAHFRDVRHLIMANNLCLIVLGVVSHMLIKQLIKKDLLWKLINPFKIFLTFILVIMSIALVNFQNFFIKFHQVMFRNRDWVFSVRLDPVIKVLPTGYFAWCLIGFIACLTLISTLIIHYSK